MSEPMNVDGLPIGVEWVNYDPKDWRNHPEPEGMDDDDDNDIPTPDYVKIIAGFDPDKEGWD